MEIRPEDLLTRHVVLRSDRVEALHAYVTAMDGKHRRHHEGPGPVATELRHAPLGRVDVGLHYTSVRMTVEAERPPSNPFLVQFPLTGGLALDVDGQAFTVAPGQGVVISPGHHARRTAEPGWTLAFSIAGDLVRARLEALLRHSLSEPVVFHPLLGPAAAEVRGYALLVVEAIDRGIAAAGGPVAAVLEDGLVDLLLQMQPHSLGDRLARSDTAGRAERIRAVSDHLDRHPFEDCSVEHLAEIAGCSVRVLQTTFASLCGLSPHEFVRRHRLTAARRLLEAAGPGATVAGIARGCGFVQLGRFAAAYRSTYGESPSETLRRAAGRPQDPLSGRPFLEARTHADEPPLS